MTTVTPVPSLFQKLRQNELHTGEFCVPDDFDVPLPTTLWDESSDPSIGLLSGPVDLAERAEEILLNTLTKYGWSQREPVS